MQESNLISVSVIVKAPVAKVWKEWTDPNHIVRWNYTSEDWHCPKATNNLEKGGTFSSTMVPKDGSMSFDFSGVYTEVIEWDTITSELEDGRKVTVTFQSDLSSTEIVQSFHPEMSNNLDQQKKGWQAIINNFKTYCDSL